MELGYIGIRTSNGVLYGGNQAHFGTAAARSGCGMTAACGRKPGISRSAPKNLAALKGWRTFCLRFADALQNVMR